MISANIIEPSSYYIKNIFKGGGSATWDGTDNIYGFKTYYYTTPLILGHTYYAQYSYKYSLLSTSATKPTWVQLYFDGGDAGNISRQTNIASADTEYTFYEVFTFTQSYLRDYNHYTTAIQFKATTFYHYPYSNISGKIRKAVLVDVTQIQRSTGYAGTTLANYIHTNYIDDAFLSSGNTPKQITIYNNSPVKFKQEMLFTKIIEADGLENSNYWPSASSNKTNANRYSDNSVVGSVYSYLQPATPTLTRETDVYSPFYPEHTYIMKITQSGTTTASANRTGGFCKTWGGDTGNYVVIEKLVAKIPVGQSVHVSHNLYTTNNAYCKLEELTPMVGTGKYEEYTWRYTMSTTGASSTSVFASTNTIHWAGYIYTSNTNGAVGETGITWNVAYYANYKFAVDDPAQYFTVLPNKDIIKGNYVMSREFNETNIYINGDGSDNTPALPSKYKWISLSDNSEIHGNHAIMQSSVSSSASSDFNIVTPRMKINPASKYRLTLRIWAKSSAMASSQSFLSAIVYYSDAIGGVTYKADNCGYLNGTMTTLAKDAAVGDTVLYLTSVNNWVANKCWSGVGFRSSEAQCYHNKGYQYYNSTGLISAIDTTNKTITLKAGLNTAQSARTIIVEALTGNTTYYPITKGMLPDGTWKEYSIEFGSNSYWGGRCADAANIQYIMGKDNIPYGAQYIGFVPNLYQNYCGYPIIYDDIKIEEISEVAEKKGDCVSMKHFSGK